MLSEHATQSWLKRYLLTGRHGLSSCYKTFIHIVDSMSTMVRIIVGESASTIAAGWSGQAQLSHPRARL